MKELTVYSKWKNVTFDVRFLEDENRLEFHMEYSDGTDLYCDFDKPSFEAFIHLLQSQIKEFKD